MTCISPVIRGLVDLVESDQAVFEISRVRLVSVVRFGNLTDRAGSGQEVWKIHGSVRVGSEG